MRLTAPGRTPAYSGDAGPCPALGQLAAGADLFIAGTILSGTEADPRLLGPAQAAACATRAEAHAAFPGGEVLAAEEGMVLAL